MAVRFHPFPFRTRKLSSFASKILGWRRPGKIDRCRHAYSSIAQSVEHLTVNQGVTGSSPVGGAKTKRLLSAMAKDVFYFANKLIVGVRRISSDGVFFCQMN